MMWGQKEKKKKTVIKRIVKVVKRKKPTSEKTPEEPKAPETSVSKTAEPVSGVERPKDLNPPAPMEKPAKAHDIPAPLPHQAKKLKLTPTEVTKTEDGEDVRDQLMSMGFPEGKVDRTLKSLDVTAGFETALEKMLNEEDSKAKAPAALTKTPPSQLAKDGGHAGTSVPHPETEKEVEPTKTRWAGWDQFKVSNRTTHGGTHAPENVAPKEGPQETSKNNMWEDNQWGHGWNNDWGNNWDWYGWNWKSGWDSHEWPSNPATPPATPVHTAPSSSPAPSSLRGVSQNLETALARASTVDMEATPRPETESSTPVESATPSEVVAPKIHRKQTPEYKKAHARYQCYYRSVRSRDPSSYLLMQVYLQSGVVNLLCCLSGVSKTLNPGKNCPKEIRKIAEKNPGRFFAAWLNIRQWYLDTLIIF